MPTLKSAFATLLLGLACARAEAPVDLRVALVIGNGSYAGAPLVNAGNDAKVMATALKAVGFSVIESRDASKRQMEQALLQVRDALKGKNGVGMLYYAGHGLQLDWHNYMVPIDARLASAADVPSQTVDVSAVIDVFKSAGNRMNIIVLDACRDNPFASTSSGKGLAQMDAPAGTLLAYATAPGNVADDGDSKSGNGLYTQYLAKEIGQPSARIEDVFKRVRLQVRKQSQGRQIPWESTSLEDDFYFDSGIKQASVAGEREREAAFNQQKADWDRIKNSVVADDFYAFLQKYPNGYISEQAQAKLERLDVAKVQAQANQYGETQNPVANRFRVGDSYDFVTKDGMTGVERDRITANVLAVDGEVARYSRSFGGYQPGSSTIAGALLTDSAGAYDPPMVLTPAGEYQVGKRWSGRSNLTLRDSGVKLWTEYEGHIAARETVVVPAGSFEAYRVELKTLMSDGSRHKFTMWMQPEWGYPVKVLHEIRSRGRPMEIVVRELVARRRIS
jgi:hypothetical protein